MDHLVNKNNGNFICTVGMFLFLGFFGGFFAGVFVCFNSIYWFASLHVASRGVLVKAVTVCNILFPRFGICGRLKWTKFKKGGDKMTDMFRQKLVIQTVSQIVIEEIYPIELVEHHKEAGISQVEQFPFLVPCRASLEFSYRWIRRWLWWFKNTYNLKCICLWTTFCITVTS